jgi:MYXO-CTERM domain-containing protein
VCAGDECGSKPCRDDSACADEYHCDLASGECRADEASTCSEDGSAEELPNGTRILCAPYVCQGVACLDSCNSSDECASGHVCHPSRKQCEAENASATSEGGCDCRSAPGSGSRGTELPWLALLLLLRSRSRKGGSGACKH